MMMKKTVLIFSIIIFCVFMSGSVYSEEKNWHKQKVHRYKNPVVVKAIGFSARYVDGRVVTQWKEYMRDDFVFYKLVKSSHTNNPVYPEDGYIFYSSNSAITRFEDKKLREGVWYYRLCIITKNRNRWISPAVEVRIENITSPDSHPTEKDFR